jgi:hypothetical protein
VHLFDDPDNLAPGLIERYMANLPEPISARVMYSLRSFLNEEADTVRMLDRKRANETKAVSRG